MLALGLFLTAQAQPFDDVLGLDVHRQKHQQQIDLVAKQALDSTQLEHAISLLQQDLLVPPQQRLIRKIRLPVKLSTEIVKSSKSSIAAKIIALDQLYQAPDPRTQKVLWETFLQSRFGLLPEDPDLFERAIRILGKVAAKHPEKCEEFLANDFSKLFMEFSYKQLLTQWKQLPEQQQLVAQWPTHHPKQWKQLESHLQSLVLAAWHRHQQHWIEALQSHQGSLMGELQLVFYQQLLLFWKNEPNFSDIVQHFDAVHNLSHIQPIQHLDPPEQLPGQFQDLLVPPAAAVTIERYDKPFAWKSILWFMVGPVFLLLAARMSKRHRLLAGISMTCGMFLCTESMMKIAKYPLLAETKPLFSFLNQKYQAFVTIQRSTGQWWVSHGGASRWQEIAVEKPHDAVRFFVLGASSAHGSNHLQEESFAALLEKDLQNDLESQSIQVVNYGIGGSNSNGVLQAGKTALAMGADVIIIYYGHNEAAQFSHYAATERTHASLRWRTHLYHSAIYSFLYRSLRFAPATSSSASSPLSPSHQQVQQLRQLAATNYKYNLQQLIGMAQENDVEVMLINVTTNYRFTALEAFPYAQESKTAITLLHAAKSTRLHDLNTAVKKAYQATTIAQPGSQSHIDALQLLAELLAQQKQPRQARQAYQKAIDNSLEISTVTSLIRQQTQQLAKTNGCFYMDAQELFYQHSPDGLSANGLFWDELHPSKEGHQRIASVLLPWAKNQVTRLSPQP